MAPVARVLAAAIALFFWAFSGLAQNSCGKPNSIAVSIETAFDEQQMPLIVLSAKNIGGHTLTCETMDTTGGWFFPRIYIDSAQGVPSKSIWYRRRIREYGYPELMTTLNAGCVAHLGQAQFAPGETALFKFPLIAYYFIDKPGSYSVHLEVHDPAETCDPNEGWSPTNTVQLEITPKQVKAWEIEAGPPSLHAMISMPQAVLALQQAPIVQFELRSDDNTTYEGDDFFPHVERDSQEPLKTTYYRERLHEPGTRRYEPFQGPIPDFPGTSRAEGSIYIPAHQSSTWEIDLRNFYKFDTPGNYSVYLEFPDRSGRMLRSNTVEFEITETH